MFNFLECFCDSGNLSESTNDETRLSHIVSLTKQHHDFSLFPGAEFQFGLQCNARVEPRTNGT